MTKYQKYSKELEDNSMVDMYGNYESVTPGVFKHSEFTFLDEQEKKYTNEDALRQQKQKVYH